MCCRVLLLLVDVFMSLLIFIISPLLSPIIDFFSVYFALCEGYMLLPSMPMVVAACRKSRKVRIAIDMLWLRVILRSVKKAEHEKMKAGSPHIDPSCTAFV